MSLFCLSPSGMMHSQIAFRGATVEPAVDHTTTKEPRPEMNISLLVNTPLSTAMEQHWEGERTHTIHTVQAVHGVVIMHCSLQTQSWVSNYSATVQVRTLKLMKCQTVIFLRVRVRSDGAAVPRHRNGADSHSPSRLPDQPPRVMPRPCSPHKIAVTRGPADSPEKRRLTTFGSAGCINHPDRKAFIDSHSQRSSPSTTRHASLGDHKTLEAEALAEVRVTVGTDFKINIVEALLTQTLHGYCSQRHRSDVPHHKQPP